VSDDKTFDEFHLKENVKNIHNLSAVVCAVHGNGTYDVQYRDGDFDRNIDGSLLKKIVVQKQKHVNKKKRKAHGEFEIVQAEVQTAEQYFKHTSIDPVANVIPDGVKRLRKTCTSKLST
jgi:mannose-6-phosphate isomerase class I